MPFELETAVGYRSFQEYNDAVRSIDLYNTVLRPSGVEATLADTIMAGNIANAWESLQKAMDAPLGMLLLGRVTMRFPEASIERLLDESLGVSLADSTPEKRVLDSFMHANFGIATEFQPGSILWLNNWTILANDSFILGGIQANMPFYLVSDRSQQNIWDAKFKRLTVTGREIIALLISGYSINKAPDGTEVFRNKSLSPRGLTLNEYTKAVDYFSRNLNWEVLTRPDLYSIDFNFEANIIRDVLFL